MRIDVAELLKEIGRTSSLKEEINPSYKEEGLNLQEPVKIKIRLLNTGSGILLTGTLDTKIATECVRCLKKFTIPLHVELDEEFMRKNKGIRPHGGEIQLTEKDFVFALEDEHILDLEEVIRENLVMALPLKPVCSKACPPVLAGPPAGKACKGVKGDPRWQKLKGIVKKKGE
ncbi:MAG: DUF177 domain-containing protein [Candidatus Saganbacteria bacterium]|nr:DUF177 domain-containing protein [Candidatus Saganbacteria bacterium]